jgi:Bacteriodetes cell division protein (FtsL-like)
MSLDETNREQLTPAQQVRKDWRLLADKLSYKAIVNNIPYMFFLAILCVIYIGNSHRAIEIERQLNSGNAILNELRWKYLDTKSQLMYVKAESQVIRTAERVGLHPSLLPAYKVTSDSVKK